MVNNWTDTCRKMRLDYLLTPHTRINSKWIKDSNVSPETIQIIDENIGSKISDIVCHNILLYISPGKGNKRKKKQKQLDYLKLKSFCMAKESINKIKRQPTELENIFANTCHKGLISKVYKEFTKPNTNKTSSLI